MEIENGNAAPRSIRAWVQVAGDVDAGDFLEHDPNGHARRQVGPRATEDSFARVIDATPGERAPDGSYRVKCELLIKRRTWGTN